MRKRKYTRKYKNRKYKRKKTIRKKTFKIQKAYPSR